MNRPAETDLERVEWLLPSELPKRDRCQCVVDGVQCSLGRAVPKSRNDRCEGCPMGVHRGHR